jgi:hypothetical protein
MDLLNTKPARNSLCRLPRIHRCGKHRSMAYDYENQKTKKP